MFSKITTICVFLGLAASVAVAADSGPSQKLSAAEIVDRNVAARGGLQAWRAVQALSMAGKMEAGGNSRPTLALPVPGVKGNSHLASKRPTEQVQLPFVMELKRPRKTRVELQFNGQTAVQVYDGENGWKLRPFLNRHEVEPYSAEEMKAAALQSDLDGPLVDYAVKGTKVELEGVEKVEGSDAYKLKLTLKNGEMQHVWIDAHTFLESKLEGTPRRMDGKYHPVSIYPRDYRTVGRLVLPYELETIVEGVNQREKIQIEKVEIDPKLDNSLFAKLR